jgi:hypothetical protein
VGSDGSTDGYIRSSLWRGLLASFAMRANCDWSEDLLRELEAGMVERVVAAAERIKQALQTLVLPSKKKGPETPSRLFERLLRGLNDLLRPLKSKKFDLEWGGTLWEIFEEGYPPNCHGIETLILAAYHYHPELGMGKLGKVGLADDHSFWQLTDGVLMDVVGNSTLKAEIVSPVKLQGYRYAFGDPEWLGGAHALQLHCIWDLGALDRARALCTSFKDFLRKYTDADYFRRLSIYEDAVLDDVYDHTVNH